MADPLRVPRITGEIIRCTRMAAAAADTNDERIVDTKGARIADRRGEKIVETRDERFADTTDEKIADTHDEKVVDIKDERIVEASPGGRAAYNGTIDRFAAAQHGVVTRAQLVDAGVPTHVVDYRAATGRLHRLFRGVYRVGPVAAKHTREAAAALACGPTAALSHRSAATMWKLLRPPTGVGPIDVSVVLRCRSPGPGVRVYYTRSLDADERTMVHGIPVTTPARTLLDLASHLSARRLEQAWHRATRLGCTSPDEILPLLDRHPRRAGRRLLHDLVNDEADAVLLRSEAEARFLLLVRRAGLPRPHVNAAIDKYEVDFLWRRERLVVEIDGFSFHGSRDAFEGDRKRDAVLAAAGIAVVRLTWRQLRDEPEAVLVRLSQALVMRTAR